MFADVHCFFKYDFYNGACCKESKASKEIAGRGRKQIKRFPGRRLQKRRKII